MKYIFNDPDNMDILGEYPVEEFQVCHYDGTYLKDGDCFDESFIAPKDFDASLLSAVETASEKLSNGDHTRLFVYMKNGDAYELELRKLSTKDQMQCSNYYGGRGMSRKRWIKELKKEILRSDEREKD